MVNYDDTIFMANLDDVINLNKNDFEYAMCRFIPEVKKKKGEGQFPGRMLYELCVAIQSYLK